MDFDVIMQHISITKTAKIGLMEKATNSLLVDDESEDTLLRLEELAEAALTSDKWIGDADDYHNFAVTFARLDQEDRACQILEKGLQVFQKNVDLLADYIKYGVICAEFEKCDMYYQKLLTINKKRWNWRAFTFSIDYLLSMIDFKDLSSRDEENLIGSIKSLAGEFQESLPNDEQGYVSEYDIYKAFNDSEKAEEVLVTALEKLPIAPKCALRLADMLYEKGEYSRALMYLKRCEIDSIQPQSGIDKGYLYLLMTLCEVVVMFQSEEPLIKEKSIENVKKIYESANMAKRLMRNRNSMRRNLDDVVAIVEAKTGVEYDEY